MAMEAILDCNSNSSTCDGSDIVKLNVFNVTDCTETRKQLDEKKTEIGGYI